jgi:hypothetical protein
MISISVRPHTTGAAIIATILLGSFAAAEAAPGVANGAFNTPSGTGPTTLTTDSNGGWAPSAASHWLAFNDIAGTTTTELVPSTLVPGGTMIHITTTGLDSGLYQDYPLHGPTNVHTCTWIYINYGAVGVGTGAEAFTTIDATLYKTGSWEVLNVGNQSTPAYTSIIWSQGDGVADFYVESIAVSESPAQCKPK